MSKHHFQNNINKFLAEMFIWKMKYRSHSLSSRKLSCQANWIIKKLLISRFKSMLRKICIQLLDKLLGTIPKVMEKNPKVWINFTRSSANQPPELPLNKKGKKQCGCDLHCFPQLLLLTEFGMHELNQIFWWIFYVYIDPMLQHYCRYVYISWVYGFRHFYDGF